MHVIDGERGCDGVDHGEVPQGCPHRVLATKAMGSFFGQVG